MKKFLSIVLAMGCLITLNAKEAKVSEVLDNYILAWNEHNVERIDTFYADDVIWYDLSYDYTTKGKANVTKAITDVFMGSVADMYWGKSGDVFVSGNSIIYEWVYGGTFDGKFDGVMIHNKKFEIKGLSTTTINADGKITSHKDYYDLASFKRQLGL